MHFSMNLLLSPHRVNFFGSKTRSDTVSTSTDDSIGFDFCGVVYSESDFDDSPVVKHRKHFKNSTQHQVASTSKCRILDRKNCRIKH